MSYDLVFAAILILRLTLFGLTTWSAWWSRAGFVAMTRGSTALSDVALAGVFFFALGTLAFQIRWLMAAPVGVNILSLLLVNIGLGLLAWGHRRAQRKGLKRLSSIFDRPDLALALIDLAALDRGAAERLAHEARRLTAEGMRNG